MRGECDLEDIGVSSMLRFIRRASALVRMLVCVKESLNQVLTESIPPFRENPPLDKSGVFTKQTLSI